jgi:hypothetical protein
MIRASASIPVSIGEATLLRAAVDQADRRAFHQVQDQLSDRS